MTKAEATDKLREVTSLLSTDGIKTVAIAAGRLATPVAAYQFARCMEVLAARFDKRSFVNICEEIRNEILA